MSFSTGKYKHWINELICKWLSMKKNRSLRILETCQGIGDATSKYMQYGYVISFEKDRDVYAQARHRFLDALSLYACLNRNEDLMDLAEKSRSIRGTFPVFMPEENTKAESGIKMLTRRSLKFDLIDVDPFGAPDSFFPGALELLNNKSFLFVTTGEMHRLRFDAEGAMTCRGVEVSSSLKWARKFFRDSCGEIVGAQIIEMALDMGICLYPIFLYNYHVHPGGVHRLGYYQCTDFEALEKARVMTFLCKDYALGTKKVKYVQLEKNRDYSSFPFRFSNEHSKTEIKKALMQRLAYLDTE